MLPRPLLQVPVLIENERGISEVTATNHKNSPTCVFLYYTESGGRKTGHDATHSYKNLVGMGPNEEFLQELTKVGGEFTGTN
ncbi:MAG: hypothetical protein WBL88_09375 [Nitrososphaeraceae archaeon]